MADLILTKHFLIETEDEEEYGLDYKDANDSEITADSADYEEKNGEESEYDNTFTGTDYRVSVNTFTGTDYRVSENTFIGTDYRVSDNTSCFDTLFLIVYYTSIDILRKV